MDLVEKKFPQSYQHEFTQLLSELSEKMTDAVEKADAEVDEKEQEIWQSAYLVIKRPSEEVENTMWWHLPWSLSKIFQLARPTLQETKRTGMGLGERQSKFQSSLQEFRTRHLGFRPYPP